MNRFLTHVLNVLIISVLKTCLSETGVDPDSVFPCFHDLCVRGQQYCVEKDEKCRNCHDDVHLCGTYSISRDCDSYCTGLQLNVALDDANRTITRLREIKENDKELRLNGALDDANSTITRLKDILQKERDTKDTWVIVAVVGWSAFAVHVVAHMLTCIWMKRRLNKNQQTWKEEDEEMRSLHGKGENMLSAESLTESDSAFSVSTSSNDRLGDAGAEASSVSHDHVGDSHHGNKQLEDNRHGDYHQRDDQLGDNHLGDNHDGNNHLGDYRQEDNNNPHTATKHPPGPTPEAVKCDGRADVENALNPDKTKGVAPTQGVSSSRTDLAFNKVQTRYGHVFVPMDGLLNTPETQFQFPSSS